jgi:hypothetical protein
MNAAEPPTDFSPDEVAKRRDDALLRALNTPPQPKPRSMDDGKGAPIAVKTPSKKAG